MSNTTYILRAVVFSLAGSVLVFFLVGMLLADSWQVQASRSIPATAEQVAAKVVDLGQWSDWSALDFQLGNPTEQEVRGVAGQSGQIATWSGPMGVASLELTRVASESVDYLIHYQYGASEQSLGGRFVGSISWQPEELTTMVAWVETGELDSFVQRWSNWFGALQDKVQQVQRSSLAGLAESLRRNQAPPAVDAADAPK